VGLLVWQVPTRQELVEAGLEDLPEALVDIDVMIGEADWMGRGVGPQALLLLTARLHRVCPSSDLSNNGGGFR